MSTCTESGKRTVVFPHAYFRFHFLSRILGCTYPAHPLSIVKREPALSLYTHEHHCPEVGSVNRVKQEARLFHPWRMDVHWQLENSYNLHVTQPPADLHPVRHKGKARQGEEVVTVNLHLH